MFARENIQLKIVTPGVCYANCEVLCLDLNYRSDLFRFILVYRSPSFSDISSITCLTECLNSLIVSNQIVILLGDFNLPDIDWNSFNYPDSTVHNLFMSVFQHHGLSQFIVSPTRSDNILDLLFSTHHDALANISIQPPLSSSDHNTILFDLNLPISNLPDPADPSKSIYYDYKNADFPSINHYLSSVDWPSCFSACSNIDDYLSIFLNHLNYAISSFVPTRSSPPSHRNRKLHRKYPRFIRNMLSVKALLWRRYRLSPSAASKQVYTKQSFKCKAAIESFYVKIEDNLSCSNDLGAFYKYVNRKLHRVPPVHPLARPDGSLTVDPSEQAKLFNLFFSSVFTVDNGLLPSFQSRCSANNALSEVYFSAQLVYREISRLKNSNSSGPDGISNNFLKSISCSVSAPLAFIFEQSLRLHSVPSVWRLASVIPIHKKGPTCNPNNYRPISLTCLSCRLMERIINTQIINHLRSHNLISKQQYGFLKRRSTCTNLLDCLNDWTLSFTNRYSSDVVYIDFSKAFDSVSHSKLLMKLSAYGISGNLLLWIESFLSNRMQAVRISNCLSPYYPVSSGVPQGSVLGPTLFIIYINDVVDIFADLDVTSKLYADDVKLYSKFRSNSDLLSLDSALLRLISWASTWQLNIATDKCFSQHLFSSPLSQTALNYSHTYVLNNRLIVSQSCTKDLGVTIDTNLRFSAHVSRISQAAFNRSNVIIKCFTSKSPASLTRAFVTFVRPLLEYCSPVWSPHTITDIKRIESVQKRFTKRLSGFSKLSYEQRLNVLGIHSLEYRRIYLDLILCYKIINALVDVNISDYFVLKGSSTTRGHPLHIVFQHVRVDSRKFFFANRVAMAWNSLPLSVISSPSLSSFRTALNVVNLADLCKLYRY